MSLPNANDNEDPPDNDATILHGFAEFRFLAYVRQVSTVRIIVL